MYARVRTVLVALFSVLIVGSLGTPALAADGDVTWTVRTASNSFGADRSSYSYAVNPGGSVADALVVANHGKTALTLGVYAADGFTTSSGQLDLRGKSDKSVGIGVWVRARSAGLVIQPGASVEVPFSVSVPDNATPGDYVGGIVTSLTQPDQQAGINVERRLGIRVKLRIGGALKPALAIENMHLTAGGTVTYTIHNTGNATLSAGQAVGVAGPFGLFAARASAVASPPELLPGESWKVSVPVSGVKASFRLIAAATVTPRLTDASGSTSNLTPVTATAHAWAVPWLPLAALLLLIALVIAAVLLLRRNRRRRKLREDARVREAVEQALRDKDSASVDAEAVDAEAVDAAAVDSESVDSEEEAKTA